VTYAKRKRVLHTRGSRESIEQMRAKLN